MLPSSSSSGPSENTSDREIVITRVFSAPRELVFAAWTDPQHLPHWWGPRGFTITSQSIDLRPGGSWRFIMHGPDGTDYENLIVYREIEKPAKIVFAHSGTSEDEPGSFTTVATFEELGAKKTRVTMRSVFRTPEDRDKVVTEYGAIEGGNQTLERLGEQLANMGAESRPFTLSREFAAPAALLFKVWTEREHLQHWWGPKGVTITACTNDPRPGGAMHYRMRFPDGKEIWGKWVYRELLAPNRLVFVSSFADAEGNLIHHPLATGWPLKMLTTVRFEERAGRTTVSLSYVPIDANEAECQHFTDNHPSMQGGWGGTFENLAAYLARG